MTVTRKQLAQAMIPALVGCIRDLRHNRNARAEVREAILRVRQLRGIIEYETLLEDLRTMGEA